MKTRFWFASAVVVLLIVASLLLTSTVRVHAQTKKNEGRIAVVANAYDGGSRYAIIRDTQTKQEFMVVCGAPSASPCVMSPLGVNDK